MGSGGPWSWRFLVSFRVLPVNRTGNSPRTVDWRRGDGYHFIDLAIGGMTVQIAPLLRMRGERRAQPTILALIPKFRRLGRRPTVVPVQGRENMPILRAEPDVHPKGLFNVPPTDPASGFRWWVLHTKPRQEKSLARWLNATGITHYLPTATRRCRIRNRILTAHVPLFTGYVFLHGDRDRRVAALSTNRVVRCLGVADQERIWADLRQIHCLLASGLPVSPESTLVPGMPVEVVNGPLLGVTGTIIRHASGDRFVVRVDFIQQGASVLIDDFALAPLGLTSSRN